MDLVKLVANNNIHKTYFYSLLKYSNFSDEVKNHAYYCHMCEAEQESKYCTSYQAGFDAGP